MCGAGWHLNVHVRTRLEQKNKKINKLKLPLLYADRCLQFFPRLAFAHHSLAQAIKIAVLNIERALKNKLSENFSPVYQILLEKRYFKTRTLTKKVWFISGFATYSGIFAVFYG